MVVRVSKWEAKTTQLTFSQPTTISLQDDEDDDTDGEEDEDDDEEEKYEDDWHFSVANKKRKNEIGANVYGYWHCWLGIIEPYWEWTDFAFSSVEILSTKFFELTPIKS